MDNIKKNEGIILEIQRLSTEDGPGIRTTVFTKGCPLSCIWCHNPESIDPKPQIQWISARCIGCKSCIDECKQKALKWEKQVIIDRNLCIGCGLCSEVCPSTALELLGKKWDVEKLANELIKDRSYFEKSGGGVTISGGEATFQSFFVIKLCENLVSKGIHVAIDTCGFYSKETIDRLFPFANLFLFDIKLMDNFSHIEFTGQSNEIILKNLIELNAKILSVKDKKIWIRTPIIPKITAKDENIAKIAEFIKYNLSFDAVERWELCLFNNLCKDKYKRLGIKWQLEDYDLISEEQADRLLSIAKNIINKENFCFITGTKKLVES